MGEGDAVPLAELWQERRFLLDVAYWMLGSPGAAESVADETCRRWYGLPGGGVAGHEEGSRTQRPDVLEALEALPSAERAAFVLHAFGVAPGTVADIVGRTEPEVAELACRARQWLQVQRSRPTTPQQQDTLARAVREACVTEDRELLASLLRSDVTAFFDGGGKVRALTGPVHGSRQVADSLLTLLARRPRTALTTHSVNGRAGLVARCERQVAAVIALDVADGHVAQVWVVLNPDKLRSWNQPHTRGGPV